MLHIQIDGLTIYIYPALSGSVTKQAQPEAKMQIKSGKFRRGKLPSLVAAICDTVRGQPVTISGSTSMPQGESYLSLFLSLSTLEMWVAGTQARCPRAAKPKRLSKD